MSREITLGNVLWEEDEQVLSMADLSGWVILVIEDEVDGQDVVRMLLEGSGAEVLVAGTAEAGLTMLNEHPVPISLAVVEAVQSTSREPIVRLPTSGGSLPLAVITDNLKTVTISVPVANYDNNQHAENENIRLQNLWDGIETFAALMTMRR